MESCESTIRLVEGNASSGNFEHVGRPGEMGGSASGTHIDRLTVNDNSLSSVAFDKSLGPTSAVLANNRGLAFTPAEAK